MTDSEYEKDEPELIEINYKELNHHNYSLKKHKSSKGKGRRPYSPWWYLINRIERRHYNKDSTPDFILTNYFPIKLNIKKKNKIF